LHSNGSFYDTQMRMIAVFGYPSFISGEPATKELCESPGFFIRPFDFNLVGR